MAEEGSVTVDDDRVVEDSVDIDLPWRNFAAPADDASVLPAAAVEDEAGGGKNRSAVTSEALAEAMDLNDGAFVGVVWLAGGDGKTLSTGEPGRLRFVLSCDNGTSSSSLLPSASERLGGRALASIRSGEDRWERADWKDSCRGPMPGAWRWASTLSSSTLPPLTSRPSSSSDSDPPAGVCQASKLLR